jgi:hypothetical protein
VEVTVKLEKCRRKTMEDMSVPVHRIYKEELSDILTRWYDMVTEIPKYDNVKTQLSRMAKSLGTGQIPEDSSKIVFPEDVLLPSKNSSFLLIDHTNDLQIIMFVFDWKDCEYLLRIRTFFPPKRHI